MPTAVLDGVEINYRQVGSGDDVVLVHGLAASQAFWGLDLIAELARHFRVTTWDLRGHGYSGMPPGGYRVGDAAADLRRLLDHLAIGRAHLVGHSWGGIIALRSVLEQPGRVRSLSVADTRVRALQPRQVLREDPDWPRLRALIARSGVSVADDEPEIGISLLHAVATPRLRNARIRHADASGFVPFAGRRGAARTARRWLDLMETTSAARDLRADPGIPLEGLRGIRQPTFAIYGERSPYLASRRGLEETLPSCRGALSPGAGHYHPVTRPRFFRESLLAFLLDPAFRP